jgi:tRNA dimethylallyltransferase
MKLPVICLMGPTASGKTHLAIEIAKQLPVDLISVDSAMVYRGMDIGTAKPTAEEQRAFPHHLIDICDPKDPYSAGQFYRDALMLIQQSHQQHRVPLLVGGTMLYFHVLQQGFSNLPSADAELRAKIQQQAETLGWEAMHEQLKKIDPASATQINSNDAQRIQRALEVYYLTQQTLSQLQASQRLEPLPYRFINIICAPHDRQQLHERIEKRFTTMLANGLITEVKRLYERKDLYADLPALRTVGYRQVWEYLAGECDYDTMQQKAIAATRQLAKRQMTWLRRWQDATWFESDDPDLLHKMLAFLRDTI